MKGRKLVLGVVLLLVLALVEAAPRTGRKLDVTEEKPKVIELSEEVQEVTVQRGITVQLVCISPREPETSRISFHKGGVEFTAQRSNGRFYVSRLGLTIHKLKVKDSDEYSCHVWNEERPGHVSVRSLKLNVIGKGRNLEEEEEEEYLTVMCSGGEEKKPPYLCFDKDVPRRAMTSYVVRPAGTTMELFCNAKGIPEPRVSWLKDGKPFSFIGYHYRQTPYSLVVDAIVQSDEAMYSCVAENDHNSTIVYKIAVYVTHQEPKLPSIRPELRNMTVVMGEELLVDCELENSEEFNVLQYYVHKLGVGGENHRVKVSHAKPIFTEAPKNLTILRGGSAFLRVDILSDAEYFIKWMKHSSENPESLKMVESRTNNETILGNPHLLYLENVTQEDAGWYTCLVANSIGRSNVSFFVDVVSEVQTDAISENAKEEVSLILVVGAPVTFFGLILVFATVFIVSKKYHLSRIKKKIQKDGPAGWIKVIEVKKTPVRDNNEDGALLIPTINIKTVVSNRKNGPEYDIPPDPKWEFPRDRLIMGKYLGEGAFGEVCQATAHGILERGVTTTVAVKTLKNTHSDADMIDLISEMETMKELGKHPNIINLLGCCTATGELLVIMEFAEHGSLLEYLRGNRNSYRYDPSELIMDNQEKVVLTFRELMSYAYQVARGMDYLAQKKYVHRDLAARNVLIAANNIAKICDFGMTRSTFVNDYYRKKTDGRVPIKWMAPETLIHRVYTTQSDVWSYGILLWEIVTLGGSPYPMIPDMNYLLEFIRSGQRMSQPPNCPMELYLIMRDCWMESPTARPTFSHLVDDVGRILYIASETEYFELEGGEEQELPPEEIITPPSSPENSISGVMFDPEFVKTFSNP